ncbi:hypothetical protein BH11MYX3_BH11MYX3_19590 [soil metagenome]
MRTNVATHVKLPLGEMTELEGGRVRVVMPLNGRTRGLVQSIVERLDGVAAEWFWVPSHVDEMGSELILDYALEKEQHQSFASALPRFAARPAIHLPELIELARYLEACTRLLERIEVTALVSPANLRYAPDRDDGAWRLMVIPLVDAGVGEWGQSAPDAWLWTPARTLLGKGASNAGAYAIGVMLCSALLGDMFPAHIASSVRFKRALRGWLGAPKAILNAVRDALPASFSDEAAALAALAVALVEPSPPSDWQQQLQQIGEQLGPYRTAVRWEYEGKIEIARGILERFAASAPKQHVPWDVLSRLRGRDQDSTGALQAAIAAVGDGGADSVRELAAVTRRLAHARPPEECRPMIEKAVAAVDALGTRLGDLGRLHFAHIEARYLGRLEDAMRRLHPPATTPWDNVLRGVILARLHAGRSEWAHAARVCKEARTAVQAMELAGGNLGAYAVAYLDHLDGVAHYGATSLYNDPGYLADAFSRITSSMDATGRVCDASDPLIEANVHWLYWIGDLANKLDVPEAKAIRTGISAYLSASGMTKRISEQQRREAPPLVWYDASRLLALSGAP